MAPARSCRTAWKAGNRPLTAPVMNASAKVKLSTQPSIRTSASIGRALGGSASLSATVVANPTPSPKTPPTVESSTLSGEELPDDPSASGSEGGSDGHFPSAGHGAAGQIEIGKIGAGNEQDDSRRG